MGTVNDREILNSIFNPLLPMGGLHFDENIPNEFEEGASEEIFSEDTENAKKLELEGIKATEKKQFPEAVDLFTKSIIIAPNRPSGYNNRAQTFRLMGNISEAKEDLNNAINLSGGKGQAACQAFCQRGLINLKENRNEEARADFEVAAKLGSQFAKAQLVQMNPYAALCNKMLKGVFEKLQRGESLDSNEDDQK